MLVPIALPPGLERNGTPYDTVQNWWDMNLMRWVAGAARPVGGWTRLTETHLIGAIRRFHAWLRNDNIVGNIVGTDTKLYVDSGGGWVDIMPFGVIPPINTGGGSGGGYGAGPYGTGTYGTPREGDTGVFNAGYGFWSFANWGQDVLFLSNQDNRLYRHNVLTPTTPTLVSEAPSCVAVGVTDERHVMIVGAGGEPHRLAWSSRESLTDWDFASVTNTAGYLDLPCTSPLIWICKVREGMLVFSSTEVFLVRFVGSPNVYGVQRIAEMPMAHPYSITTFGAGRAAWFSPMGFYHYSNGAAEAIACPIFADIIDDLHPAWGTVRCHMSANGLFPEIWFFWPSANSSGECDRYVIANMLESWWAWGNLERSAMVSSGALKYPRMGDANGVIYEHENGWTDAGAPILSKRFLESGALGIGNGDKLLDVKQALLSTQDNFHPQPQSVKIQFFGRYAPDGAERVFGPYTPRLDGYTDTRVNCREGRVRLISNVDALFDIGLLRLDVSPGGGR